MGKTDVNSNLPGNPSLSYTLEHLRSFVVIEPGSDEDRWFPLEGFEPIELSATGREKFLRHFARLKAHWDIPGHYTVCSANNFASDCGLASSASSFAALTKAAALLAEKLKPGLKTDVRELSRLARLGSGSSCRSFFSPWAIWRGDGAENVDLDIRLEHAVLLIEDSKKQVSSSEAHKRVVSSALFAGRAARAEVRMMNLFEALRVGAWTDAFEICWNEFWDMHALFETSQPPFGYMQPETLRALNRLREIWAEEKDGPLVTMDAGANIHLLLRPEQRRRIGEWAGDAKYITSWSDE